MNNKRTTVVLAIFLVLLIVLLVLRTRGALPWNPKEDNSNTTWSVAWENVDPNAASYEEELSSETAADVQVSSEPYAEVVETIAEIEEKPAKESVDINAVKPPENKQVSKSAADKPEPSGVKPAKSAAATDKPAKSASPKVQVSSQDDEKKDLDSKPKTSPAQAAGYKPRKEKPKAIKGDFKPFYVYKDLGEKENHYMPYGFMGDIRSIKVDQGWRVNPYGGKTCIRIAYAPTAANIGWAGIYWQHPANNWGDKGYGYNLTGAKRVSFWAKGDKGGEVINNFIIGGIQGKAVEDSDSRAIGPIELAKEWRQYFIYLDGADITNIIGGFCVTFAKHSNEKGIVFYLDDIIYE